MTWNSVYATAVNACIACKFCFAWTSDYATYIAKLAGTVFKVQRSRYVTFMADSVAHPHCGAILRQVLMTHVSTEFQVTIRPSISAKRSEQLLKSRKSKTVCARSMVHTYPTLCNAFFIPLYVMHFSFYVIHILL